MRMRRGAVFAVMLAAALTLPAATASAGLRAQSRFILGRTAAVLDVRSGSFLYAYGADEPVPPASLAKMLVAIIAVEHLGPNDLVPISHAAAVAEADSIRWPEGHTFRADDVLHGMLLESSNGAAIALAERISGSVPAFMQLVNARAVELGAARSHFVTPNGLDAPDQFATAHDIALIADALMRVPWLASIVSERQYEVRWPNGTIAVFHNRDRFLYRYEGAVGVKNGYTSKAGNFVAAHAVRGGRMIIVVVMNSPRVFDDAAKLMDWGFAHDPRVTHVVEATGRGVTILAGSRKLAAAPSDHPLAATSRLRWLLVASLALAYVARVTWVRHKIARRRRRRAMRPPPEIRLTRSIDVPLSLAEPATESAPGASVRTA